jgi:putative colanic acid biosynthesis glycosyltransferase
LGEKLRSLISPGDWGIVKWQHRVFSGGPNSEKPLITVITISFNEEATILETVASIACQIYPRIEHILIDGGSDDNTVELVRASGYPIDIILSEPDDGIYDAMNKGINLANGEWIIFINAGDRLFSRDSLALLISNRNTDSDILYGGNEVRFDNHKKIKDPGFVENLWKGMICSHQSVLAKSSVLKYLRFNISYSIAGDFDFLYRAFMMGKVFTRTECIVSSVSSGGVSDVLRVESIRERMRVVANHDAKFYQIPFYRLLLLVAWVRTVIERFVPKSIMEELRRIKRDLF